MQLLESMKEQARKSWPGAIGDERAKKLEEFLIPKLVEYSECLGLPQERILESLEKHRRVNTVNFYQEANLPSLKNVRVFETQDDIREAFPSMRFRCPFCKGITSNPYECNSGIKKGGRGGEKPCDWKTYGLFRTLGKGLRITVKKGFLERPYIDEIFMPLELEAEPPQEFLWYERDVSALESGPRTRKPTKLHINVDGLSLCGKIVLVTDKDVPNPSPTRKCKSCLMKSSQQGFSIKKSTPELATAQPY